MDSWTRLGPLELLPLFLPAGLLVLALVVPGRGVARVAAAGLAIAMPFLGAVVPDPALRAGWAALWMVVAWRVNSGRRSGGEAAGPRPGGVESGAVGLLLGLALVSLLVAAVARQDLPDREGVRASYGLLVMCLGLLHLMLRRDAVRAMLAFGALGLGLQVLEGAAREVLVAADRAAPGIVLLATAIAVAAVERLARARARDAGSSWVSDAHDLHD